MDDFPILGRSLAPRVRTPSLATWLERHWCFPEHALTAAPYTIHLAEVDAPPPQSSAGTPVTVPLHRMRLTALAGDDVWWFGDGHSGVQLRLGDGESRIAAWGVARPEASSVIYPALFVSVAESLRASGLLPLHAAVAARDGRATVLAGPSGVGKSTTLWRMMRADWAPLAEDFAWLDPATLHVYGWDRGVRLHPDARERFAAEVPAEDFRVDADGKLFLAYDQLARPVARTARLERLAMLERLAEGGVALSDTSGTRALAPHVAVRAWWETIGLPLSPATRDRVAATIAMLVQRVTAVRLPLGAGPLPLEER